MSLQMVEDYRRDLRLLSDSARRDVAGFLYQIQDLPVAEVRELLTQVLPELVNPYLEASGDLAATWYEDLRAAYVSGSTYYQQTYAHTANVAQTNAMSRWAVAPLAAEIPDAEATVRRLAGAVQRMVFDRARGVVEGAATGDPHRTGFQRMARPGCCAFCGMLASRGAAYRSAESAGMIVGRGSTRERRDELGRVQSGGVGSGVIARGSRGLGNAFHDDCHCVVVPVFAGTEMADLARAETEHFLEMYQQSQTDEQGNRATTPKQVLKNWREYHGTS